MINTPAGRPVFELGHAPYGPSDLPLQFIGASVGDTLRLHGWHSPGLRAGELGWARVHWEVAWPAGSAPIDIRVFGHLVDEGGRRMSSGRDVDPLLDADWRAGDTVLTWLPLEIPAETPTGGYWLNLGFYTAPDARPLSILGPGAPPATTLRLGPVKVAGREPSLPDSGQRLTTFADQLSLTDVDIHGRTVNLTWRAESRIPEPLTVFVHALDAAGEIVAQHDGQPHGGSYPTQLWDAGEVISDPHDLLGDLSRAASLSIGVYRTQSLERLPIRVPGGSDGTIYTTPWPG